ncbi:NAD(P)H-quinone oxidoreductase subunit F [Thermostichus vulcanus]|uniref:NAD(P)H-quinone oxidoreductase subunit F n=1 Tax=Thermostichus vulcanus str. 'Rupite' TaxID=2813851 RepID=A0ABT0CA22_THEVL|nr:NAD(P)H-quinone oxidoreductase subunit F [Thermostichus vulcanus]MCJ2542634.1 NAD(P)H-quinone oxidoreductase subunit F [Thermostichus vulcanus str. 'Rupite']
MGWNWLVTTIWMIPLYALLAWIGALVWLPGVTRRTGPRPAGYLNALLSLVAFIHSVGALVAIWGHPVQVMRFPWMQVGDLVLELPLQVSAVTLGACVLVTGLNLAAQVYGFGYMEMDWGWARFFSLLGLFEGGMCALALCDSLFFSYVILEILTLGTYLLVGLWFNQPLVVTGARDAFLTKRVGDLLLLMGVIAIYPLTGSWDFEALASWAERVQTGEVSVDPTLITLVGLGLLAGSVGKCAQFPLHLWLDEAMEGPIPATILRNAVVVGTGAWVLIRLQPLYALSPTVLTVMLTLGGLTAVGGSLVALAQIDAKRALSYLVSAYMGLIFVAVGTGHTQQAYGLLLTYAPAMALLVMAQGTVIWNSITQDLRYLGGLWSRRPVSGLCFLIGMAGMIALPPFGSFWVLTDLWQQLVESGQALWAVVLLLTNGITALGLMRVFGLIWAGKPQQMSERSPEVHWPMILPMTVVMGVTLHMPMILAALDLIPALDWTPTGVMTGSSLVGIALGAALYLRPERRAVDWAFLSDWQDLLANDFYTPKLYRASVVFAVRIISEITALLDRYVVDGLVNLTSLAVLAGGQVLKYTTSGQLQVYLLTIVVGVALLGWLVL